MVNNILTLLEVINTPGDVYAAADMCTCVYVCVYMYVGDKKGSKTGNQEGTPTS